MLIITTYRHFGASADTTYCKKHFITLEFTIFGAMMSFKLTNTEQEKFIKEADKKEINKRQQAIIYLNTDNKDFLEKLKYNNRVKKISMSDFVNEAIELVNYPVRKGGVVH